MFKEDIEELQKKLAQLDDAWKACGSIGVSFAEKKKSSIAPWFSRKKTYFERVSDFVKSLEESCLKDVHQLMEEVAYKPLHDMEHWLLKMQACCSKCIAFNKNRSSFDCLIRKDLDVKRQFEFFMGPDGNIHG